MNVFTHMRPTQLQQFMNTPLHHSVFGSTFHESSAGMRSNDPVFDSGQSGSSGLAGWRSATQVSLPSYHASPKAVSQTQNAL